MNAHDSVPRLRKKPSQKQCLVSAILLVFCGLAPCAGQNAGQLISARHGMVVSASDEATKVGVTILRNGGNAVDAAVAVGFALSVTYPSAGNLGGGAFLVIRMADGREAAIDAREVAPERATKTMYLDASGNIIKDKSLRGPLAAGVPGSVDGLLTALKMFGTMDRTTVLRHSIALARDGFRLKPHLSAFLHNLRSQFENYPSSMNVFYRDGQDYRAGEIWKQPDLARTLDRIARNGHDGFYDGLTASLLIEQMTRDGGIITREDLKRYSCIIRPPVHGMYRGYEILSMPPVSAGGIALIQILNILESFPLAGFGPASARAMHVMIEAERRAYADRSKYIGDPAFVEINSSYLLSKKYAGIRREQIDVQHATPSSNVEPGIVPIDEGNQTTHFSVIDRWGNAVSVTTTLNSICGGKCVVEGAGFLLNNEMDDFSIRPDTPNQFGLTGGAANSIAPGKRMVSSMTPTIVLRDDVPYLILGSPGGSTIITTVAQVIINVIDHAMHLDRAVITGRFHHQWKPDSVFLEPQACSPLVRNQLQSMGHSLGEIPALGRVDAILFDRKRATYYGVSDPRGHGAARGY